MIESKEIKSINKEKKVWSKPKLFSGKEIGFMGLGRFQASTTGPYGTPS